MKYAEWLIEPHVIKAKSRESIKITCHFCNNYFNTNKHKIQTRAKFRCSDPFAFCSHKCWAKFLNLSTRQTIYCLTCNKPTIKRQSEVKENAFCSKSCSATYTNTHKTVGIRRSKLEVYLEQQLNNKYPKLELHFNRKDTINSELDIYIPSLKLAFELNGIFHYEPIFSKEKLDQIQNNDSRKFQACLESGIELCIIDVSSQKRFTESSSEKYLDIITSLIDV